MAAHDAFEAFARRESPFHAEPARNFESFGARSPRVLTFTIETGARVGAAFSRRRFGLKKVARARCENDSQKTGITRVRHGNAQRRGPQPLMGSRPGA